MQSNSKLQIGESKAHLCGSFWEGAERICRSTFVRCQRHDGADETRFVVKKDIDAGKGHSAAYR